MSLSALFLEALERRNRTAGGTLLMFTSDEPFLRFPSFRQAPRGKDGRKYADGRETTEKRVMELSVEEEQQLLNSPGEAAVMDHVYRALGFLLFFFFFSSVCPSSFPLLRAAVSPSAHLFYTRQQMKQKSVKRWNGWIRNCCLVALNRTSGSHGRRRRRRRSESSTN